MKKFVLSFVVSFVFLFGLAVCLFGCSEKKTEYSKEKLEIVTTIFPQYDFIRQIVKNRAEVKMLVPPGVETHIFEPTPKDVSLIEDCSLFVHVGGENDSWVEKVLENVDYEKTKVISLVDCVGLNEILSSHDKDSEFNDHVWTSIKNVIKIVEKLTEIICKLDVKNSDEYYENSKNYIKTLEQLDEKFRNVVSSGKRKVLIFADRFPFEFFSKEYGLECYHAFSGCSAQVDANFSNVEFLINKVNKEKIPVVLKLDGGDGKIADVVASATGAGVRTFYSCHNVNKLDFEKGETFLSYMEKNLETLKEALG